MKRKRIILLLLAMILAVAIAGCNDKKETAESSVEKDEIEDVKDQGEVLDETVKTEDVVVDTDSTDKKDNTTSSKNETPKKEENAGTTTKPSTGNTQKPSVGNSNNNNSSTTQKPSNNNSSSNTNNNSNNQNTTKPDASTTTQPSTPVHEHSWIEVTEDEVHYYAWRTICGKCGEDLTDLGDDGITYHSAVICHNGYTVKFIEVDYITENVQKETIVTGYKCECGATKNK